MTKTDLPRVAQFTLLSLLGIAFALGIYQHVTYRDFPYGPFRELDTSLRQRHSPEDLILHSNKLSMLPAMLFDRQLPQSFIGDPAGSRVDTLAIATQQVLNIDAEDTIESATMDAKRVWFIIYERSIDEYQAAGFATHPDIDYLNSQFHLLSDERWDGLRLLLYTKEP
jgi:hypothetical protein